jgi:hypothetical protein
VKDIVPLVGCAPVQPPLAVQDVAVGAFHVSVALCPAGTMELSNCMLAATPLPDKNTCVGAALALLEMFI